MKAIGNQAAGQDVAMLVPLRRDQLPRIVIAISIVQVDHDQSRARGVKSFRAWESVRRSASSGGSAEGNTPSDFTVQAAPLGDRRRSIAARFAWHRKRGALFVVPADPATDDGYVSWRRGAGGPKSAVPSDRSEAGLPRRSPSPPRAGRGHCAPLGEWQTRRVRSPRSSPRS